VSKRLDVPIIHTVGELHLGALIFNWKRDRGWSERGVQSYYLPLGICNNL